MTYAKGKAGNYERTNNVVFADCLEKQSAEDDLLNKAHAYHAENVQYSLPKRNLHCNAVPQVGGHNHGKRYKEQIVFGAAFKAAQAVFLHQLVSSYPDVQNKRKQYSHRHGNYLIDSQRFRNTVRNAEQNHVCNNPYQCKRHFVFFV